MSPQACFNSMSLPLTMNPATTLMFIAICALTVAATFVHDPVHSLAGLGLTLLGFPVYLLWRRAKA